MKKGWKTGNLFSHMFCCFPRQMIEYLSGVNYLYSPLLKCLKLFKVNRIFIIIITGGEWKLRRRWEKRFKILLFHSHLIDLNTKKVLWGQVRLTLCPDRWNFFHHFSLFVIRRIWTFESFFTPFYSLFYYYACYCVLVCLYCPFVFLLWAKFVYSGIEIYVFWTLTNWNGEMVKLLNQIGRLKSFLIVAEIHSKSAQFSQFFILFFAAN